MENIKSLFTRKSIDDVIANIFLLNHKTSNPDKLVLYFNEFYYQYLTPKLRDVCEIEFLWGVVIKKWKENNKL